MKERIKKARKSLDLTQREFAERIGMKANTIATYEMGRAIPSDAAINNICKEFRINELWLRTGEGDMLVPPPQSGLEMIASKYPSMSRETLILVEKIINLPKEKQDLVVEFIKDTARAFLAAKEAVASPKQSSRRSEKNESQTIREEADAFASLAREQFLAEKKRESETSSVNESAEA